LCGACSRPEPSSRPDDFADRASAVLDEGVSILERMRTHSLAVKRSRRHDGLHRHLRRSHTKCLTPRSETPRSEHLRRSHTKCLTPRSGHLEAAGRPEPPGRSTAPSPGDSGKLGRMSTRPIFLGFLLSARLAVADVPGPASIDRAQRLAAAYP